jgi:O-antigen ligase
MMTLHRGVALSWLAIGIFEAWRNRRNAAWWNRSAWKRVLAVLAFAAVLLTTKAHFPIVYENRVTDVSNYYARVAQQRQTLAVFLSHFWLGAGFNQFNDVVSEQRRYLFFFKGEQSVDYTHNMIGNIAAETGIIGLFFFIVSQILLVVAFQQLRTARASDRHTFALFISIFIAYWVVGMDLTSGYYSELNMWYMFAIAILFRYSITEEHSDAYGRIVAGASRSYEPQLAVANNFFPQ